MSGVLAVGDSLTAGPGVQVGALTGRSWASWLAWSTVLPLADHALSGATTTMVVRDQLPLAGSGHKLALTLVGANDIGLGPSRDRSAVRQLLDGLVASADAVLVGTLPRALLPGLSAIPGARASFEAVRQELEADATRAGAHLVVFDDLLTGAYEIAPDGLHPSALGQLVLARRAAVALDLLGFPLRRHLPDPREGQPGLREKFLWRTAGILQRGAVPAAAKALRPLRR